MRGEPQVGFSATMCKGDTKFIRLIRQQIAILASHRRRNCFGKITAGGLSRLILAWAAGIDSAAEQAAKHHTFRQQSDIPDKTALEPKAILASRDAGNAGSCLWALHCFDTPLQIRRVRIPGQVVALRCERSTPRHWQRLNVSRRWRRRVKAGMN